MHFIFKEGKMVNPMNERFIPKDSQAPLGNESLITYSQIVVDPTISITISDFIL